MPQLMPGADLDLVKPLADRLKKQGVAIHLKTKVVDAKAQKNGITCNFEGESIPDGKLYDRVLVSVCLLYTSHPVRVAAAGHPWPAFRSNATASTSLVGSVVLR